MPSTENQEREAEEKIVEPIMEAAAAGKRDVVSRLVRRAVKEGQVRAHKWTRRVLHNQIEREFGQIEQSHE